MTDDVKPTRIRSPSYPSIDLETAINRCKELHDFAKKSPALVSAVLPRWGYKTEKSANGMKVIAALKSFGLIEDSGRNAMRKVTLTDRSYRIIHGVPDTPVYLRDIQDCAMQPSIYRHLLETYGPVHLMPDDSVVGSYLILERKFNESAIGGFLQDYKSTMIYANINAEDSEAEDESGQNNNGGEIDKNLPTFGGANIGDLIQWESNGALQFLSPLKVRQIFEPDADGVTWVFVEGSETGIDMSEVIVETASQGAKTPPIFPLVETRDSKKTEKEFLSGSMSKTSKFRLLTEGEFDSKALDRMIKMLAMQKEIWDDEAD